VQADPFRVVNEIATHFLQTLINQVRHTVRVEPGASGVDAAAPTEVDEPMKHEAILAGQDFLPRDPRVDVDFDLRVHCEAGEIDAQLLNLSSDGFRLHSANPLQAGWEVTLEAAKQFPVKALICWACGNDAGGVFEEPVAL
jgi:hypothetical protein